MAAMFRNFAFEAASRHPSSVLEAERSAMNVSPTSTPFPPPPQQTRLPTPPPCSMRELAQKFNRHNLRVEVDPAYEVPPFYEPLTPPSDDFAFPVDSEYPREAPYSCLSPAEFRLQRQANTQMQCSPSHIKDISLLVGRMIEEGDQCCVYDSKPRTWLNSSEADEDEGVDMDYNPPMSWERPPYTLKLRRSGDRLSGQAMVSKSVRMRKRSRAVKRTSSK
ncbi:hypothetical protein K469DRAFT_586106 [Zopfia rhizophila CBS 207.26]|uniref:Uncharacterized protein n=1 Tax=Zopfia rhizophila CBS 207.26 TaxID=1314779 RepID=A0A6A6DSC6_9PEZI|nr:hypothetical protein K469DRAFT_586106 [Zopfia rhizophila CBS 207.26]